MWVPIVCGKPWIVHRAISDPLAAFAASRNGSLHRQTSRVTVAFSNDAGATFGHPIQVDDGRPLGRVDVVLLDGRNALVSWLEQVGASASLRVRRVSADGGRGETMTIAESSAARSSGFPRMVRSGGEVIIAWRDSADPPKLRSAVLSVSPADS